MPVREIRGTKTLDLSPPPLHPLSVPLCPAVSVRTSSASSDLANSRLVESKSFSLPDGIKVSEGRRVQLEVDLNHALSLRGMPWLTSFIPCLPLPSSKVLVDGGQAQPMVLLDSVTLLMARITNLEELVCSIKASELTAALARYERVWELGSVVWDAEQWYGGIGYSHDLCLLVSYSLLIVLELGY